MRNKICLDMYVLSLLVILSAIVGAIALETYQELVAAKIQERTFDWRMEHLKELNIR